MISYTLVCPNAPHTNVVVEYGSVYCYDDLGNWEGGYPSAVAVSSIVSPTGLSAADISILLSATLLLFSLAWGFRVLGQLIFKGA